MKIFQNLGKLCFILVLPLFLYSKPQVKLELSKTNPYVGESLKATLILSYTKEDKIIKRDFEEFIAKNFWIKEFDEKKLTKDNITYEIFEFILTPQKYGSLKIDKQLIRVAHREAKTNFTKWNRFYTKPMVINVLPIPDNLTIQGDFTLESILKDTKVEANKPLDFKIKIQGYGNLEDIDKFAINLPNELVYSTKPQINTKFEKNNNYGEFTQSFSIIANEDFTLPSISFKYFNTDTKEVEVLKTKEIKIEVLNKEQNKNILFIILGILVGLILFIPIQKLYKSIQSKKKEKPHYTKVNSLKDKELYELLLPYSQDKRLIQIIKQLEDNIYKNTKNKIDKKKIADILREENVIKST